MAIKLVNRYKQMLSTIPRGSFYSSDGQVLPFRDNQPYELRITTGVANRQYEVLINDVFITIVITNPEGIALLSIKLYKGRNDIKLVDTFDQTTTLAYITTRDYATILASEAQVVEQLDTGIEQVLLDSHLATSSIGLIEQIFGKTVSTGNNFGLDLDTYRELLMELRTTYRYWGGTVEGISRAVRAFTQISPLIYPAGFGPVWILGKDIISSRTDAADRAYYSLSSLTNINAGGAGVTIEDFSPTVGVGAGTLKSYSGANKTMSWTPPNGGEGAQVVVTNGEFALYGLDYIDPIIGFPEPFNIAAGANDIFSLEMDGHGPIDITLTAGAARTATQIATDINSALSASLLYGVGYATAASSYDSFGSGFPMVRLTIPLGAAAAGLNPYADNSIRLMPRIGVDATQTIFNAPVVRGGLNAGYGIGVSTIVLSATTDMTSWPLPTILDPIKAIMGGTTFHPTGAPNIVIVVTAPEMVTITNVNKATRTLTLATPTIIAHNQHELIYLEGEWPYKRPNVHNSRGVTVNVTNYTLLPGAPATDAIVVAGTGAPDGWIVTTNAGAPVTPTPFAQHVYFELDRDVPFDLNANGMVTIPIPDEILKYKGFDVHVAIFGRIDDPSRAATQSTINTIDISFDDQVSYSSVAPTTVGLAVNSEWRPQEYIRVVRVPATATKMWVRVKLSAAGVGNFTIHKVRITLPVGHGGLFLGDGTIPRVENKIKQGSFLYVWSPDPLSVYEDSSLGLTNVTQVNPGHIDKLAPSESWLEKFDVTEYDLSNNAINARGVFTEVGFIPSSLTNLGLVLRTPPRFSHVIPTLVSDVVQTVVFNPTPAYTSALTVKSDQVMSTSVLLQDGVPLTQNNWQYNNANQIELLIAPSALSVYSFSYQALIQLETTTIDLGIPYADYLWFADFHVWLRPEIESILTPITLGIQFDANGVAFLEERSTKDQSTSTLIEDTGLSQRIIPISQWSFLDAQRIQIDQGVFNVNRLYSLKYTSESNHPSTDAQVKVELRSAATGGALGAAIYSEVIHNQVIDGSLRYHQMRVTLSKIRDVRDARIQSVLLKGLNMFGVGGSVPILRP